MTVYAFLINEGKRAALPLLLAASLGLVVLSLLFATHVMKGCFLCCIHF